MGVHYKSQCWAECDNCKLDIYSSVDTIASLKQKLRQAGWTIGKKTLCPACARKATRRTDNAK